MYTTQEASKYNIICRYRYEMYSAYKAESALTATLRSTLTYGTNYGVQDKRVDHVERNNIQKSKLLCRRFRLAPVG